MQLKLALGAGLVLAGGSRSAPTNDNTTSQTFDLASATLQQINDYALSVAKSRISGNSTGCTSDKLVVRKYW